MKKTLRSLETATTLLLLLVVIGCSKSDTTITPPTPSAPTLTVSATPDTTWYSGTAVINWTTTNATSVTMTGGSISGTSGSFTTPVLLTATIYTFTATGAGGTVTKSITTPVYSQARTFLCWDNNLHQLAKFKMISDSTSFDGGITWLTTPPANLDSNKYVYLTTGIEQEITPNGSIFTLSYQLNGNQLTEGFQTFTVTTLNATTLTKRKDQPGLIVILTYNKVP